MAIEQQVLEEISRSVARVGNSSESFRTIANQQNNNIQRIIKDVSSMFRSQSRSQAELASSIDDLKEQMANTNEKTDAVSARLGDTVNIQNSMLGELRSLNRGISNLTNFMMINMMGGSGGGGVIGGPTGNPVSNMMNNVLGAAALGGGAAALLSYVRNLLNGNTTAQSSNGEISAMAAAIKQKETGSEQDPYTAIARDQATNQPLPLGAETGTGAYQFTPPTWREATQHAGVGTEYTQARDAPPEIQDRVARDRIEYLRQQSGGDISQVPSRWRGSSNPQTNADYRANVMENYNQRLPQQNATPTNTPGASTDITNFLKSKIAENSNVNFERMNPDFAAKMKKAIEKAKEVTGVDAVITSASRTPIQQAKLYANYLGKTITYDGNEYKPDRPGEHGPFAAPPGKSKHETGQAIDLVNNEAAKWITDHAQELGLGLAPNDPGHFADPNPREEQNHTPNELINGIMGMMSDLSSSMAGIPAGIGQAVSGGISALTPPPPGNIMAGLEMPTGMGPASEPQRIGMGDMDSYNPMGILGALAGGNMFGPSGQVGAAGAAINVLGAAANRFEPSEPDNRAARLNQTAVEQTAQAATPWQDPGSVPGYQPPSPEETSRRSRIDPDIYNHPDDRNPTSNFGERLIGLMGLGLPTWIH